MIFMFVVVDIELEMGYTVVVKVFRAVASIMEVMVDMAIVVGGMVEVDITSVIMQVIFKEIQSRFWIWQWWWWLIWLNDKGGGGGCCGGCYKLGEEGLVTFTSFI